MFSLLTNSFRKNITCYNCFHRTAFTHNNCNNRVSEAYRRYNFDHRQIPNLDINREVNIDKRDNEDYNGYNNQGWKIFSWYLIALELLSYCLAKNQVVNAEEENEEELIEQEIPRLPDNLSLETPYYTEMSSKKNELEANLKEKDVVIICGAGGVGKSTLVKEYGREYKNNGWQVRWIEGNQIEEEFLRLALKLDKYSEIKTKNLDSSKIRDYVYNQIGKNNNQIPILLIFDNVEKRENIEKYLCNLPKNSKVIITTRNSNLLNEINSIKIDSFNENEAMAYFSKGLKQSKEKIKKLIQVVGLSPFRLSKALVYLKMHNLKSIEEYIEKYQLILKGINQDDEIYPEVELLFRNLRKKSVEGWELIKYLACLNLDYVSLEFIADIMEREEEELRDCISYLEESSLIDVEIEKNKKKIKLSHKIVQNEVTKALIDEDKDQREFLLKILIQKIDNIFPDVDKNPENSNFTQALPTLTRESATSK